MNSKFQKSNLILSCTVASLASAAISGCGSSSSATVTLSKESKCSKTQSLIASKHSLNASLNSKPSTQPQSYTQNAIGTGFIDIETKDKSGKPISRRCTMTVRPIDQNQSELRVWTAGHCSFDPATAEFFNSKYTLQIFQGRGYFSVPVNFEELEALSKFASVLDQTLFGGSIPLPDSIKEQVSNALPQKTSKICEREDKNFRSQLGHKAKNIACFSRNEMRGLKAKVALNTTTGPMMQNVIKAIKERESPVLEKFSNSFKKVIDAYLISHSSEQRRYADMRSISYLINKNFCDPNVNPKPLSDSSNKEDPTLGCLFRSTIIDLLKSNLPETDYSIAKSVFDDVSTDLQTLRKSTIGCNNISIENISNGQSLEKLTPCDMGNISDTFWKKYVDQGPQIEASIASSSIFGLNQETYYGLFTNSAPISTTSRTQALLFSLNLQSILNFEFLQRLQSGESSKENSFLVNYNASENQINFMKGASGSLLSVFGIIPAGLLSTVDGEATSGGTAITPLPQLNDDDSVPAKSSGPSC